jgi:TPP-dependent pyruvate/acetoin dehydrogenase alpha subunit
MPDHTHSKSRRGFMTKSVVGSGLILGAPSILSGQAKKSSSDEIRVAFIGCGRQHEGLFNAMQNLPGLRFIAACDLMKYRHGIT